MTNDPHDKPPPRWPLDLTGDGRDRNRVKTPPTGVTRAITEGAHLEMQVGVVTLEVADLEEFTDRYEGVELEEMRATREPEDRMRRIENKHDKLVVLVHERLGRQDGQLETLVRFGEASEIERARRHAAEMAKIAEGAERRRWLLLLVKALGAAAVVVIGALAAAGYFK